MLEAIGGWFADLFRTIFLYLDYVVYWLVDQLYALFVLIADTGLFSPDTIQEFGGRIYVLLAIIMIFIVSFSMIKYIINPDDFLSEKKGVSQLLKNFFIVLIAIVAVPSVFSLAFQFQSIVLKENLIGKIVLGSNINAPAEINGEQYDQITFGGKTMAATVFSAFFKPNQEKWEGCNYPDYNGCTDSINATKVLKSNLGDTKDVLAVINAGIVNEKIEMTVDGEDIETYAIEYTFLVSAIAGCLLVYVLLVFCIDIAIRSVKLGFLQLIAPVPIVSLLDPREKGSGMFSKWVKTVISTYMSLFIRLIAIYFAIAVVMIVAAGGTEFYRISDNSPMENIFVRVFIIFGCLLFAKELPKMLEELTGMKLDGGGMNLKKRLQSTPGLGVGKAAAFGAGGLIGAGAASAIGNYRATKAWNAENASDPKLQRSAFLSALGGGLAGAGRGAVGGATGGRAGISGAIDTTRANQERNAKADKGVKFNGETMKYNAAARNADRLAAATGGMTRAQRMEEAAKDYEKNDYKNAQEAFFSSQQELSKYEGFTDDGKRLHVVDPTSGEVKNTFDNSTDIDTQRQLYMDEYAGTADEKAKWAEARFAEETGVSEADWKEYEQKIRTKDAKDAATSDYIAKQRDAHDKENELANRKREAEKQKKLQDSYKIGSKPDAKKKK
ncbi:MAG: conjugal transfer protein TrbL family protein [Ignavibacteriales bacterium]